MLISVGELNVNKNHEVVIKALASLDNPNIKYVICGQGSLEKYLSQMVKELRLESQVRFLGFRNDIAILLALSDIFVVPSKREGLGMAPLEAMASGLPLISSYVGGIKDYTEDGETGCCIEPNSVEEMMYSITKMYREKAFRDRCGHNNCKRVKSFDRRLADTIMTRIYSELGGR